MNRPITTLKGPNGVPGCQVEPLQGSAGIRSLFPGALPPAIHFEPLRGSERSRTSNASRRGMFLMPWVRKFPSWFRSEFRGGRKNPTAQSPCRGYTLL